MQSGGWGLGKWFWRINLSFKKKRLQCGFKCKDMILLRDIYFFPSPHPIRLSSPPCFWPNPNVCSAQADGLLKQHNQVELSYCKCSPSGVSHFQGPHEHMRCSCESSWQRKKERVGGYKKWLWKSSVYEVKLGCKFILYGLIHKILKVKIWHSFDKKKFL